MEYYKGQNINLRPLETEDLNVLYDWENNPDIWTVSNTITPYSKHVLLRYIESAGTDIYSSKQLRLVIEKKDQNKAIGFIDLFDFDPYNSKVGIGILIAETKERNKGFAAEALQLMLEYVSKHLGLKQAYCNVTIDNKNSMRLFEKAGFTKSGIKKDWVRVQDTWLDEALYQLIF
ncbi:MAG: diamine N-acetyltransferase [Saprospiraceae bacterium]|jgi:diamine N-acetyltransferase